MSTSGIPSDSKSIMTSNAMDQKDSFSLNSYSNLIKLSSGTFDDWKLRLTTALGAQRLSKYILKDLTEPTEPNDLEIFETNSLRALAAIHATIDDENFQVIRSCSSPRDTFTTLCKHHDDAGGLSTAHLFSDLVTLKMNSDDNLSEHIARFRKLHNNLLSNLSSTPDCSISEPFVAIILIKSLPSDFTPLVQSLLANFETLTLSRLYSLLKIEATRSFSSTQDSALSASKSQHSKKNSGKKKSPDQQKTSHLKCSLGHPGHTDENCRTRKWKAFLEFEKSSKSNSANQAQTSDSAQLSQTISEADEDMSYWESAFSATTLCVPIIGDTGAPSHMFSDLSLLSNLKSCRPTRIGVASKDGEIWARHQRSVRLARLTLKNVLHSPKLTGNLISIGRLCDDGYNVSFNKNLAIISYQSDKEVLRMRRSLDTNRLRIVDMDRQHAQAHHTSISPRNFGIIVASKIGSSSPRWGHPFSTKTQDGDS